MCGCGRWEPFIHANSGKEYCNGILFHPNESFITYGEKSVKFWTIQDGLLKNKLMKIGSENEAPSEFVCATLTVVEVTPPTSLACGVRPLLTFVVRPRCRMANRSWQWVRATATSGSSVAPKGSSSSGWQPTQAMWVGYAR